MAFNSHSKFKPFESKIYLSSPTMHGEELQYLTEAYQTNWVSTVGENINQIEKTVAELLDCNYAVALSTGTAALHLATRLAGEKLYGKSLPGQGVFTGKKVFCSDMTFCATVNPLLYEGALPVFIDTEYDTWNMDPAALEKAFELYPEVKTVMLVNLYGFPAKLDEIKNICDKHGALLIEDAAESMGAAYKGKQTGSFGSLGVVSFNGNKIITGSSGGMLLTRTKEDADKARKWSTQAREDAPWYQHEETGYNYRMSNIIAGIVRGQLLHIEEHIVQKKAIYERYKEAFADLPIKMLPFDSVNCSPNYWLSCMIIENDAMAKQVRSDNEPLYIKEAGKTCPTEILEVLAKHNAEGRPIWKPMHMQPIYRNHPFITAHGDGRATSNAYIEGKTIDVGADIFHRGLCLPSDNKMTPEQQQVIIELVRACFG